MNQGLTKRREILTKLLKAGNAGWPLLPTVQDEDIGAIWRYKPCDRVGPWCMFLARHDLLPLGCLAPHLPRILTRLGGAESPGRSVVTLWFVAFALGCIGLCAWFLGKALARVLLQ